LTNKEYLLKMYEDDTDALADDLMDIDSDHGYYWHFAIGTDGMVQSCSYLKAFTAQVAWLEAERVEME